MLTFEINLTKPDYGIKEKEVIITNNESFSLYYVNKYFSVTILLFAYFSFKN